MTAMQEMLSGLRRVVTCVDENGRSKIMIDGGPATDFLQGDLGGLSEIWHDAASGPLDAAPGDDLGKGQVLLSPDRGKVKIRWFSIAPPPEGAPEEMIRELTQQTFIAIGAGDHQPDTSKHPAMHATHTLDAIILIKGQVRLILDEDETVIHPGDVVIQRATNHAWVAEGGEPALFVAVLIDR